MPVMADNLNVYNVDVFSPDGARHIANPYTSPFSSAHASEYFSSDNIHRYSMLPGHEYMQAVDNLPMFSAQVGVYGSLPLSRRCALGAKAIAGYRIAGSCSLDAEKGLIPDKYLGRHKAVVPFDQVASGDKDLMDVWGTVTSVASECINLDVKDSYIVTAGLSFTMLMRHNMGCKFYVDYSNSRCDYDLVYSRVDNAYLFSDLYGGMPPGEKSVTSASASCKKAFNTVSAGVALQLNF